jgi:hypothetical protein
MTVLTMRYQQGHFVVSGSDMEPIKFKTRREARNWCIRYYPGSPIRDSRRVERPKRNTRTAGGWVGRNAQSDAWLSITSLCE